MTRSRPWLKMWGSWLDDSKMLRLTMPEQAAYWRLYVLAHRCQAGGLLVTEAGSPLTVAEIANIIHITSPGDMEALTSMLNKMQAEKEIILQEGALFFTSYQESQALMPSNTPEAVAKRQRDHREKVRKESASVTPGRDLSLISRDGPLTTPDTNTVTKEVEEEQSKSKSGHGPKVVTSLLSQETRDPLIAEVTRLYQENITEKITSPIADELRFFADNYHGQVEWLSLAFSEALSASKCDWRYIRKILEDWEEKGGPDGRAAQKLRRGAPRQGGFKVPKPDGVGKPVKSIDAETGE